MVVHVAAGGLGVEPLADVALVGAGPLRELRGGQPAAAGERAVEAELVAHHHERGVERGSHLVHGSEEEGHQLLLIDGGWCGVGSCRCHGGHREFLLAALGLVG